MSFFMWLQQSHEAGTFFQKVRLGKCPHFIQRGTYSNLHLAGRYRVPSLPTYCPPQKLSAHAITTTCGRVSSGKMNAIFHERVVSFSAMISV